MGVPISECDAVYKNFVLENIRIQTANEISTLLKLLNDYTDEMSQLFSLAPISRDYKRRLLTSHYKISL
jgi:hypothetical protein